MTAPTPPMLDTRSGDQLIRDIERLFLMQQEPIAALQLAAYAVDAMRVLMVLERHADMSKAFDDALKAVCPDWRNPGSIDAPADLIAVVLAKNVATLLSVRSEIEQVLGAK